LTTKTIKNIGIKLELHHLFVKDGVQHSQKYKN